MHIAIGLRELPDNPVLARRRLVRLYGPQPHRLADFELVCCHALTSRPVSVQLLVRLPAEPSQDGH
jgi:hypothetical protein